MTTSGARSLDETQGPAGDTQKNSCGRRFDSHASNRYAPPASDWYIGPCRKRDRTIAPLRDETHSLTPRVVPLALQFADRLITG
jgi:hypothetical protein